MSSDKDRAAPRGRSIEVSDFQAPVSDGLDNEVRSESGLNRGTIKSRLDAPWWHSQFNVMLCAFGLLGFSTLLFILITPPPAKFNESTLVSEQGEVSKGQPIALITSDSSDDSQVAPYDAAQKERARTDSQDILSDLLDAQKALEQKGVSSWAKEQFDESLLIAERGDQLYQQQDYVAAIDLYKSALESLDRISELIPAEVSRRAAAGFEAISEGKSSLALEQFQASLSLDQNYIPALQGLQRVKTLDQVLQLLATAKLHEQDFDESDSLADIQLAKQVYQQAIDLDSQSQTARLGLEQVIELEVDKQFRMAMTEGFESLFAARYSSARTKFNAALQFRPNDETATSALRQSLASDKRTSLTQLLKDAKRFEKNEQWLSALSNYQTVLQRDRNQVSAKIGSILAKTRLDLDNSLKQVLVDPLALSKASNLERAQAVLNDARGLSNKGPLLIKQIAQVESLLNQLDTTISVAISSDQATNVSLKKVGSKRIVLGRFDVKKLALKPGRYTLTGTRLGFRDVLTDLELTLGTSGVQSFSIQCDEQIGDAG